MRMFVWFMLAVALLDVLLMALALAKKDFERDPKSMAVTIFVSAAIAAWAAFVLAV